MQGISTIELVKDKLQAINFPRLTRPAVRPEEPPTEELVRWGIKMYSYALIAQVRKVLTGLVQLAKAENVPATTILARHIFEFTAHACYMSRNLKYGPMPSLPEGWPLEIPDVLRIGYAITEYEQYQIDEYGRKEAKENYSLLSELSHPNAACLQQHYVYDQNGRDVEIADALPPFSALPHVDWCLIDILRFLIRLFELSNESGVRSHAEGILRDLAERAPKSVE